MADEESFSVGEGAIGGGEVEKEEGEEEKGVEMGFGIHIERGI